MKKNIQLIMMMLCALLISVTTYSGDNKAKKTSCDKTTASIENSKCEGEISTEKLFSAIRAGKTEKVMAVIDKDPSLLEVLDKKGCNALYWSASGKNQELIEYLLDKGMDINFKTNKGQTALLAAVKKGADIKLVEYMMGRGAELNVTDKNGATTLHYAVSGGKVPVIQLCLDKGMDINAKTNDWNNTPLHKASWSKNSEIMQVLLINGADVNVKTKNGDTPLMFAVRATCPSKTKLLLKNEANINARNNDDVSALYQAVSFGNPKIVALLLENGAKINSVHKKTGYTELHVATIKGFNSIAEQLVEYGADLNATDNENRTSLYYAKNLEYSQLTNKLLAAGAKDVKMKKTQANNIILASYTEPEASNVWHLGHAGWAVKSENNLLVFDYWEKEFTAEEPALANGHINPEEIRDLDVYVFVSHKHWDHYSNAIFGWEEKIGNITYVYGFDPKGWKKGPAYEGPDYIHMKPHETKIINNLEVSTLKSNDSGVAFLVKVNGKAIYHSGDHASKNKSQQDGFKKEIDFISEKADGKVDLAFISVTGCGSSWFQEDLEKGFIYTIEKLNPEYVFPQHGGENFSRYDKFIEIANEYKVKTRVIAAEYRGMRVDIEGSSQLTSK